jgi:hypothetical protein
MAQLDVHPAVIKEVDGREVDHGGNRTPPASEL